MKRTRRLQTYSLFLKVVACSLTLALPLGTGPRVALALPHGGIVAKGAGPAPPRHSTGKLLISRNPNSASFNWSSYKVKAGQSVIYLIPGSKAVSLKYVGGTTPSSLSGTVASNGIQDFMNPKGLIFGSGSVVSRFGVMDSGSAKRGKNFTGPVSNAGKIKVMNGGRGILSGSSLANSGTIKAPGGKVHVKAGFTVTPIATSGVSSVVVITPGKGLMDDSGIISAEPVGLKTGRSVSDSGTTRVFKALGNEMIALSRRQLLKNRAGRPDGSGGTNGPGSTSGSGGANGPGGAGGSGGVKGSGNSGGAGGGSSLLGSGGTGGMNGPGGAGGRNGPGSASGSGGANGPGGAGGSGGVQGTGNSGGAGGGSGLLGSGGAGGTDGSGSSGGTGGLNGSGSSGGSSGSGVTGNQSTVGSSSSGSIGTFGITINKFNPVFQTVNIQSLSAIPAPSGDDSSEGDSSQAASPPSLSITLDESKSSSVTVLQAASTGIDDSEILSAQQIK